MSMRSEHLDLSLSVPHHYNNNGYVMSDQTFHTPSFGDEEFDIPPLHMQQLQHAPLQHYQHHGPQMGMINPAQDGLSLPDGQPSYQQPLYLQPQEQPAHSAYSPQPPGNYLIQQQPGGPRLLVMQPPQQPGYGRSPPRGPAAPPAQDAHTTSEDSDDSAPHHAPMGGAGGAVKRPSPEPAGAEAPPHGLPKQLAKKPKVQKKKKKRDPNEPQKPVSAYALFFRDTQAAIKGQNPNASFGEVSKIVASMWDGLDSEHKSVYKQKTEAAKKEYLKALAAYRASLVSKGGEPEGALYAGGPGGGAGTAGAGPGGPYFYPAGAAPYGPGQASPPAPARSPLLSPPHHLGLHLHHAMGPPHHHYMHHQPQPSQLQSLTSPHQSPQHHGGPGSVGPQGQHMGPQLSPMGPQAQQHGQPGPQMGQQGQQMSQQAQQMSQQAQQMSQQAQQMNQQGQQMNQQAQQMNQQGQQMSQQAQQMQGHPMQGQAQLMSPQGQPSHQSPPHSAQQNHHPMLSSHQQHTGPQQSNGSSEGRTAACIRHGCTNPAIANNEWEDEYCSNECVVSHCRDVFSSWVASNNTQSQTYSAVK